MLHLFVERNLNRTVAFLNSTRMPSETVSVTWCPEELLSVSLQNTSQFYKAYCVLHCPCSRAYPNSIVFCACCTSRKIFLRNNSLLKAGIQNEVVEVDGFKTDAFLDFIRILACKKKGKEEVDILISVINLVPLFWEAYEALCEIVREKVVIDSPLSGYFYAYMSITRGYVDANHCVDMNITNNHRSISINSVNLLAAWNYCNGNSEKALELFKTLPDYTDISFFEFYGILLYNSNDPSLKFVCEMCSSLYKNEPETFVLVGLYCLSLEKIAEARDHFKKAYSLVNTSSAAYRIRNSPDIACLLAYSHVKLNDYEKAIQCYEKAGKTGIFRILYSVAQGYFAMSRMDECLGYCKRAIEKAVNDSALGSIYKLAGRVYQSMEQWNLAIQYFEDGFKLGEMDSLLYLAEVYKKKGEGMKVIELYERYLERGEKNVKSVAKYLEEYFEEMGDLEKMQKYRGYCV